MKLIIDIPKEVYRASRIIDVKYEDVIQIPLEVLANGTPLDDVKAEIREQQKEYQEWGWAYDDVLDILDNIGKENQNDNQT